MVSTTMSMTTVNPPPTLMKSAKRYLEELGVSASHIQTTSYGEVKPFCKEQNEKCWQQNRRAHFVAH